MEHREILIVDADTSVEVLEPEAPGEPARLRIGGHPYGFTLAGDLPNLHRLGVEIDTRLSRLIARSPAS